MLRTTSRFVSNILKPSTLPGGWQIYCIYFMGISQQLPYQIRKTERRTAGPADGWILNSNYRNFIPGLSEAIGMNTFASNPGRKLSWTGLSPQTHTLQNMFANMHPADKTHTHTHLQDSLICINLGLIDWMLGFILLPSNSRFSYPIDDGRLFCNQFSYWNTFGFVLFSVNESEVKQILYLI